MNTAKTVRIGGASGFWGDSSVGAPQLVRSGKIDYLVFDYLAETTMAVLAAQHLRNPAAGYATDFVDTAMAAVLGDALQQGIKIVTNAGGINPTSCAQALRGLAAKSGLKPRIAVVEGDDVRALTPALRESGTRDMFTGEPFPEKILSANAYLGAFPIAAALAAGADVVITGRCVDSAVTLGPLIHEFGWTPDDFDFLASGGLAGHIIECGCQATGGLHTDWQDVPDWANIGYPIVECHADGSLVVTKPPGTGGLIRSACVAEQLLYEIGDPSSYLLPDVTCDFRDVRIDQLDELHVCVSGARGRAPGPTYKVSATTLAGYRCTGSMLLVGIDAAAKAQRTGEAMIERTRRLLSQAGMPDYTATQITLLGAETIYGPHSRADGAREVMVRVTVDHPEKRALELFAREVSAAGTSWSPGTTGPAGGRPSASPLIKQFSFLLDKSALSVRVQVEGDQVSAPVASSWAAPAASVTAPPATWQAPDDATVEVPLIKLVWARSGDKGNLSNIGLIARRAEWLPMIWQLVTPEVVKQYFSHFVKGRVERFHVPGIHAINYVMHDALDGGGPASARNDPLGKGIGQMLLDLPVRVPSSLAKLL